MQQYDTPFRSLDDRQLAALRYDPGGEARSAYIDGLGTLYDILCEDSDQPVKPVIRYLHPGGFAYQQQIRSFAASVRSVDPGIAKVLNENLNVALDLYEECRSPRRTSPAHASQLATCFVDALLAEYRMLR
ncbi:hypothetical protein [Thauera sp. 2A1]|uniref:hypothetical protein n=1 Tax=Thauera sp. 2A1 TaxID=2570191 RepID=UPI001291BBC7|nr:hypothetical protein [Thauera sp. 2A1]KAI5915598.1 hypothetical protein GH664_06545 [Thauera sp. 2A1]